MLSGNAVYCDKGLRIDGEDAIRLVGLLRKYRRVSLSILWRVYERGKAKPSDLIVFTHGGRGPVGTSEHGGAVKRRTRFVNQTLGALKEFGLLESDCEDDFSPGVDSVLIWLHPVDSRFVVLRDVVRVHEWLKETSLPQNAMICLPAK